MDGATNESLERQRAKRKRVSRMKKLIICFLSLFIIFTMVIMVFLCIKIGSLQRQINELSQQIASTESVTAAEGLAEVDLPEELYTVDNLDNLAQKGDIPTVYLTFDDGPSENTDKILDILDDYNVKATFFVVGKDIEEYGDQYRRIVEEGHTIGMHSFSHNYSEIYSSEEAFEKDYLKIKNLITEACGVSPDIYRFPGGSSNKVSNMSMSVFINYLNSEGVRYFDWNVASGDATSQAFSPDELVDNVMSDVVKYKASVVLLHDGKEKNATVEALPQIIESLQDVGAMILPISDETTVIQHVSVVQ